MIKKYILYRFKSHKNVIKESALSQDIVNFIRFLPYIQDLHEGLKNIKLSVSEILMANTHTG